MYSKRLLLTTSSLLLLLSVVASAQNEPITPATKLPDHPRILLLKGEENAIKKTLAADKTWKNVHQAMLGECDRLLSAAPVERIQIGRRLLDKSREALRRVFLLAYAWRMTQQKQYLQRAETELLAVSAFSDWNPSHFLDVAEMTMAVAIGYDWLHNDLSPASRSAIKAAILKKGIEPSLDPKFNSWLKATHNWNQVCNAGMTYGALAIYEDQPELARTIINRAIDSIELPMEDYAPDGAYPEGYSYWGYGTSFNVMFISALEKAFGSDFGLSLKPGFLRTAAYMTNMTGPSGNSFNYSDAGTGGGLQPAMFWFANKLNDPSVLWVERGRLLSAGGGTYDKDRLLPAIMLWSNGIRVTDIPEPKSRIWVGDGKSPVALMRTSWSDPSAIFVGLKAGSPSVNHAHMDVGSFVMEADGVRWAMDFGMQDYNSLESKGVKLWGKEQDSQRWQVYRYNNFVHNTLTVNNELQKVDGNARIARSANNPQFMSATTDLSELYKGLLNKASRGIAIVNQNHVVVRDEIETPAKEATVRWTLLTSANVTITGKNRAELTKNGRKLVLQVEEPAAVTLKTWSTDPPHEYDAANPGTTLVGFEVTVPANTNTPLTVLLLPEKAAGQTSPGVQPLAQWPK
ncbi:heparinase [Fibrisoma montanum]|uniref:Heparinase n=1 Tax=Fibrisoma montanum TaxID=2305895 RepID=A0A418MCQ3_9BACT|nr:heparinase II/III family protein [Fibrisoma montanum]RIV24100.1 heparinase [Fibrisoma montanum]